MTTLAPDEDRTLLARWAVLGYELSVLKARSLVDSEAGKKYLEVSRLISNDEWVSMVDGDRHTTVWVREDAMVFSPYVYRVLACRVSCETFIQFASTQYWIQSKAARLNDAGALSEFKLQTICNAVTLSRDKANDLMSCIDRDQPPPCEYMNRLYDNASLPNAFSNACVLMLMLCFRRLRLCNLDQYKPILPVNGSR